MDEIEQKEESLLPHYVYVLADPRDQNVFYVGKGQENRLNEHWAEVLRDTFDENDASDKQRKLAEIRCRDEMPLQLIVGRYETNNEALAVEATLINWVYGYDVLTNRNRGRGGDLIRGKGNLDAISGIDIRRQVGVRDGEFSNSKIKGLVDASAYEFLDQIRTQLIDADFAVRDFSSKQDRPFDPGESNGYLGLLIEIKGIDFIVGISKTKRPGISIANTVAKRQYIQAKLRKKMEGKLVGLTVGAPKNTKVESEGRYIDFYPKKERFETTKAVKEALVAIRDELAR